MKSLASFCSAVSIQLPSERTSSFVFPIKINNLKHQTLKSQIMKQENFDYRQYLADKKSIDDQSLNRDVWKALTHWGRQQQKPLRIIELGAGIGTMIERLLDAKLLACCQYSAIEIQPEFRVAAAARLSQWCKNNGANFTELTSTHWQITRASNAIDIHWHCADALAAHTRFASASFDLMIGHAVIDLLPVPVALPQLLDLLDTQGAFYFSLNYAGTTHFTPAHDLDDTIFSAYHADMNSRFPELDWQPSRTGALLATWLQQQGHRVIAQGDSHWQLQPTNAADAQGRFVANILDTIESALPQLEGIEHWLATRRAQLAAGELNFVAENRDCFGIR